MKLLLTLLAALSVSLSSCSTTEATRDAFTDAAVQTGAYFAAAEVLTKADSLKDWQDKHAIVSGLVVVLQGVNQNVTDPVALRLLIARYFEGKPPHWMALSQLLISWINTNGTEAGRSRAINAAISGLQAAASQPYSAN
jgi:hypothetical protein